MGVQGSEKFVVTSSDMPCTAEACGLNGYTTTNFVPGTEYVVLEDKHKDDYFNGDYIFEWRDDERHEGAFTMRFTSLRSIVRSRTAKIVT